MTECKVRLRNRATGLYYEVMPDNPDEHAERLQRAYLARRPRCALRIPRTRTERFIEAIDRCAFAVVAWVSGKDRR